MIERETMIVDRGAGYAVGSRRWQLPGLAGRLRAVHYVGEQTDINDLAEQLREPAAVIRLESGRGP